MKFIILLSLSSILLSEEKYKEPQFILLDRKDNIEIREYGNYIVAKTSIPLEESVPTFIVNSPSPDPLIHSLPSTE